MYTIPSKTFPAPVDEQDTSDSLEEESIKIQSSKHLYKELDQIKSRFANFWQNPDFFTAERRERFLTNFGWTTLSNLVSTFALSEFEQDILLLCAGVELDEELAVMCRDFSPESNDPAPNRSIATTILSEPEFDFADMTSPLRDWKLLHQGQGLICMGSLAIDPWILQYLLGNSYYIPFHFRGRLAPKIADVSSSQFIPESYQKIIEKVLTCLSQPFHESERLTVQLCGRDIATKHIIAATVCEQKSYFLCKIDLDSLASCDSSLFQPWLLYWHRRAKLNNEVLLIDCGDEVVPSSHHSTVLKEILSTLTTPVILSGSDRIRGNETIIALEVPQPTLKEQAELWAYYLGSDIVSSLDGELRKLAIQFNLSGSAIQIISTQAHAELSQTTAAASDKTPFEAIWNLCRSQARAKLEDLVERKDPKTTWDELILNDDAIIILQQIIACIQNRAQVYGDWEMGGNTHRGMGITAMFHGPSGTGKTTAAEIIARELQVDLYQVDLSQVSDKYIGETEKKLAKIFDMAESSGALLLFDEADSIIGKRSDVKDSKDRYANQTVGFLLQRMEAYSGVAIMTTNLPNAIDTAFMRRIKYSIRFEYPNIEQRATIWSKAFPPKTPKEELPLPLLAQLNISGASIRGIALSAAFLAAAKNEAVSLEHILKATRAEYQKQGRTLSDREIHGWSRYFQ
jgi:SpoVK/Ycf46/Vps4 family AAA+-type ATPase